MSAAPAAVLLLARPGAHGSTAFFLGKEYQANSPSASVTRGGDAAADPAFADWLATAGLTPADVTSATGDSPKAVWGLMDSAAENVASYAYNIGDTEVTASISGWNDATGQPAVSGNAALATAGGNSASLQENAPRPAFARGAASGYYLGTSRGAGNDTIRNGVSFDLSGFSGGGVYSFGIFGGDLETGAPGSPSGFLRLTFTDSSTETILYTPDSTLFGDAAWTGGNNTSGTYGNRTTRFMGFVSDDKRISSALFVVGDDDLSDTGSSEQLSFIAGGVTFLDRDGNPWQPPPLPEPSGSCLLGLTAIGVLTGRRRNTVVNFLKSETLKD